MLVVLDFVLLHSASVLRVMESRVVVLQKDANFANVVKALVHPAASATVVVDGIAVYKLLHGVLL